MLSMRKQSFAMRAPDHGSTAAAAWRALNEVNGREHRRSCGEIGGPEVVGSEHKWAELGHMRDSSAPFRACTGPLSHLSVPAHFFFQVSRPTSAPNAGGPNARILAFNLKLERET